MPSLDFVRDICQILKKQDIDYILITCQKGKNLILDAEHSITSPDSFNAIAHAVKEVHEGILEGREQAKKQKKKDKKKSQEKPENDE